MTARRYRLYQIDAFTTQRLQGNPAGVVTNADGLSVEQMQAIARELNNSETAFVLPPDAADHDVRVRFFTPTTEVPSCGHATIAAHYARAIENSMSSAVVVQKIGAGILPVEIIKQEDDYKIVMTQGAIRSARPTRHRRDHGGSRRLDSQTRADRRTGGGRLPVRHRTVANANTS